MSTRNPCASEEVDCDSQAPLNVFDRHNCSENSTTTILHFQYQIQTTSSLPLAQIQSSDALRSLEDAIIELLSQSFSDCYDAAWSAAPADAILPGLAGVTCHSRLVPAADRCLILDGALTVPDNDILKGRLLAILRQTMVERRFNQVHFQIPDVVFVSDEAFVKDVPSSETTVTPVNDNIPLNYDRVSNDASNGNDPVWAWILFPIGSVLLVVAFVAHHRYCAGRRRRPKPIDPPQPSVRRDLYRPRRLGSFPSSIPRIDETEQSTTHWDDDDDGRYGIHPQHQTDILWDPPPCARPENDVLFPHISYYYDDDDDEEFYHNSITSSSPGHSSGGGGPQGTGRFPIGAAWM
jgi:hypothetical protein